MRRYIQAWISLVIVLVAAVIAVALIAHTGLTFVLIACLWVVLVVSGVVLSVYNNKHYHGPIDLGAGPYGGDIAIWFPIVLIGIFATHFIAPQLI